MEGLAKLLSDKGLDHSVVGEKLKLPDTIIIEQCHICGQFEKIWCSPSKRPGETFVCTRCDKC